MAGTAIQNIKILHKRYSKAQWLNGITVNGLTIIPTLAQGEIGLATDTLEVRIGTNSAAEQTFAQARTIGADLTIKWFSKNSAGSWEEVDTQPAGTIVVKVEEHENNDTHEIYVYYDKISVGSISDFPDFKVNDVNTITAGDGEVKVVTALAEQNEHELGATYATAATKNYVDTKFSTAKYIDVVDGGTAEDSGENTIDYIDEIEESTADHTIIVKKKKLVLPSLEINDETETEGSYISKVEVDSADDHKILVTKKAIPQMSVGQSTDGVSGNAQVITGVSVDATDKHKLIPAKKTITAGTSNVSIDSDASNIKILVDGYTKSEVDNMHNELAKAMKFMGTLDDSGSGTVTSLPAATVTTIGHVYKVALAYTYNGIECKVGDLFVCDNTPAWKHIPSGDDVEDTWRPIYVGSDQLLSGDQSSGAITFAGSASINVTPVNSSIQISHADTSSVENLTSSERQYVTGLTFDEYGHVTGYNVGVETVVDTNSAHSHTAGAKLTKTGDGGINGNVEYAHEAVATTTEHNDSKKVTITPGDNTTFRVVDSLEDDDYGHITKIVTKDVQINAPVDTNTLYDIGTNGITGGAVITLTPGDALDTTSEITVKGDDGTSVSVTGKVITISSHDTTYDLATTSKEGLVKVANVLEEGASGNITSLLNYTGNNNTKLYGVNRKADGTLFVEVPWTDTTYTASTGLEMVGNDIRHSASINAASKAVDMYAFGTDAYGHISQVAAVTTIDGNYA